MSVTVRGIVEAKYAEATQTTQYTATNVRTTIDKFTVSNVSGGAETIAVNIVPSGGAAANSNLVLPARSLASGEVYICPELVGHVLEPGDMISTVASATSSLVIRISGREVTTS